MDPISLIFGIGALIASFLITSQMTPTNKPSPATLEEFDFPQVDEGTPQAVIFGDCNIDDWTVLWYGNMRTSAIKSDGGKK